MGFFHHAFNQSQRQEPKRSSKPRVEIADETVVQIFDELQDIRRRYGDHLDREAYRDNRQWEQNTFRWLMRYLMNSPPLSE